MPTVRPGRARLRYVDPPQAFAGIRLAGTTAVNTQPLLLEREADAARIGGALRSAKAGSGGNVLIEGAAGIGKTSLLGRGRGARRGASG